jgi:hypothetical protein
MMLKVQKFSGEIPKSVRPGRKATKYPFADMGVGDFFFIPHRNRNTMHAYVYARGRALEKRFVSRLCYMRETTRGWRPCLHNLPDAVLGIGVWREA